MIPFEQARAIALEQIIPLQSHLSKITPGDNIILVQVVEFDEGWLFFLDSQKHLETQNILDQPLGLGPIIVGKENGVILKAGSGESKDEYINNFKKYIQGLAP